MKDATPVQRGLMARGALLFLLSLLTGVWVGAVMTDGRAIFMKLAFTPSAQKLALVAHMNALIGSLWLVAVAATLEATRLSEKGKLWLARAVTAIGYSNWIVTLIASFADRKGLEMVEGDAKNNAVALLLIVLVVVPGLGAAAVWAWSLLTAKLDGGPPA